MSTVLALRFPAGRYHATPWGSHANEAEIEWPPSPWRILRALVASWHRKLDGARFPEDALGALIDGLSASSPVYRVPAATRAHSRHYMPVRAGAVDRPVLIFDAFARVDPAEELIVAWPGVMLAERDRELLGLLASVTTYLGRAESWVEARLLDGYGGEFNCTPAEPEGMHASGGRVPVRLLAPLDPSGYAGVRSRCITEMGLDARRLTRAQRRILSTLPPRLLDALRNETGDLRDTGWNLPPGARVITYVRPPLEAPRSAGRPLRTDREKITTVRLALAGKPLPRIEDAVRIGELVRAAAISVADRLGGAQGVPPEISGHGSAREPHHRHAFYLPEDADDDGFIDHVLIYAPGGLSRAAVAALDGLHRRGLWTRDGERWAVVFEGAWEAPADSGSRYGLPARTWISATPYLHPWYAKPGFRVPDQVRRECAERGLPEPADIRVLPSIRIRGRERRAVHFHRFRSKRGLRQPDTRGALLEIRFSAPLDGPLALGFGCHYGLGMFAPQVG